ncbi:hypothetical protein AB1Y20_013884 [Prymnesium parvum]|uniref:G8 domain-containing protein n=1 Tax=Prymnesium parvum TaxID=97485 RepID=A0AB34IFE7_PRYPA
MTNCRLCFSSSRPFNCRARRLPAFTRAACVCVCLFAHEEQHSTRPEEWRLLWRMWRALTLHCLLLAWHARAQITPDSSELVQLAEPSDVPPSTDPAVNCPHLQQGLLEWLAPSTWPSLASPTAGDVTLPENSRVLLSATPAHTVYGVITVPASSELIIGSSAAGIELRAAGISVYGALRVGSETCRLQTAVTITLYGTRPDSASTTTRDAWHKGIFVSGVLDVHGKRYFRTWSRLAAPAVRGQTQLLLQHEVNWEAGQTIILTTTELKDSRDWHRNEELTIASVALAPSPGVGALVTLTSAVQYQHHASEAYQAEVGLLSRKVKIQGAADSEPTDTTPVACRSPSPIWSWSLSSADTIPCPDSYLTGFGGHVMVSGTAATGRVSGVELYRMGQTNVLGRYPMHFHMMGEEGGRRSYLRDSSIHRSFYRCVSVHGTHYSTISQNVAYDVIGHCYYLEDGIEENNVIEYNLGAHVHFLGIPPGVPGQFLNDIDQSENMILPADSTASPFYITNANNAVVGNAASGGWAGFSFPALPKPVKLHRTQTSVTPEARTILQFDGNSAHSSGYWWENAGAIYFGGRLWHPNAGDALRYNPGRQSPARATCTVEPCTINSACDCWAAYHAPTVLTNTKVFLSRGTGVGHWGSRPELVLFEAHDVGLAASILGNGGRIDQALVRCRTGNAIEAPGYGANSQNYLARWKGSGFEWYDTHQAHIVTRITFRNCGVRRAVNQPLDGCGDGSSNCRATSSVWGMLTHSDEHVPEFMQATALVRYEACGRRFRMINFVADNGNALNNGMSSSVSERYQSWLDADGSASGSDKPTIIASASADADEWWRLDGACVLNSEESLWHCERRDARQVGSLVFVWDAEAHARVGGAVCANGIAGVPCTPVGGVSHWGRDGALPLTLNGQVTGPLGGYGWHVHWTAGAPRTLRLERVQVSSSTSLLLSLPYPASVSGFTVAAHAPSWCSSNARTSCVSTFRAVGSVEEVRASQGDTYYWSGSRLYIRVVQPSADYTGTPDWRVVPDEQLGAAARPYERNSIKITRYSWFTYTLIQANCVASTVNPAFCSELPVNSTTPPQPCRTGFTQTAYDQCCDSTSCEGPGGVPSTPISSLVITSPPPTTAAPTAAPTTAPTASPTQAPTSSPTSSPTSGPTVAPTVSPTAAPTPAPLSCRVTPQLQGQRCSCRYIWESLSTEPTGAHFVCS